LKITGVGSGVTRDLSQGENVANGGPLENIQNKILRNDSESG